MKKITAILFIFILMLINTHISYSQVCVEFNCPDNSWNQAELDLGDLFFSNGQHCHAILCYCWKGELDERHVYLEGIWIENKYCVQGSNLDDPFLWDQLLQKLILHESSLDPDNNPEYLFVPPCTGPGPFYNIVYKEHKQSCWYWQEGIGINSLTLKPCESTGMCITAYAVCWDYGNPPNAILSRTYLPALSSSQILCSGGELSHSNSKFPNSNPDVHVSECWVVCNH